MNCYEFELNLSNFIEGELKQKKLLISEHIKKDVLDVVKIKIDGYIVIKFR